MAGKKGATWGSQLFRDMRTVYKHPEHIAGERAALAKLRDKFHNDFDGFMKDYKELERERNNRRVKMAGAQPEAPAEAPKVAEQVRIVDEGSDRAEEVISKLLDDFEREHPQ